jgi:Xaa-Pro aminopeptidase
MVVARQARIERVQNLLEETGLDGCVLKGMDNIFYLTGFRGSEGSLFVTRGDVVLVVDFRYMTHAREVTRDIHIEEMRPKRDAIYDLCTNTGSPSLASMGPMSLQRLQILGGEPRRHQSRSHEQCHRRGQAGQGTEEISAIMAAIEAATKAFTDVPRPREARQHGKEIADELDHAMRRRGATGPSFETIVASARGAPCPCRTQRQEARGR